jgi:hypothetical protein
LRTPDLLSASSGLVRFWMLAATVLADDIRILNRFFRACFSRMDSKLDSEPESILQVIDYKWRE